MFFRLKNRRLLLVSVPLLAVVLAGYSFLRFRVEEPPPAVERHSQLAEAMDRQVSVLGMELRITNERIREEVKRAMNKNERSFTQIDGKDYEALLQINSLEEPQISIVENRLSLSLLLDIALFAIDIKKKGLPEEQLRKKADIRLTGKGRFSFDWKVDLNSDWTVSQDLQWSNEWEKSPWLYYKGLYLPVASVIKSKLNEVINKANQSMGKELTANLQAQATKFWQQIQQSQRLYDDPTVWLRFIPKEIHLPTFTGTGQDLLWRFAVVGDISIWVQEQAPKVKLIPLADLKPTPIEKSRFQIRLPILSSMATIAQNMEVAIAKVLQEDKWRRLAAEVSDIQIYPTLTSDGERELVIGQTISVRLWGVLPLSGVFYFRAKPSWDQSSSTLVIQNLRWQSQSQNFLERLVFSGSGRSSGRRATK